MTTLPPSSSLPCATLAHSEKGLQNNDEHLDSHDRRAHRQPRRGCRCYRWHHHRHRRRPAGLLADAKGDVILAANRPAERSFAGAAAAALALPVVVGATSVSGTGAEVARYGGLTNETVAFQGAVLILEGGAGVEGGPAAETAEGAAMGATVTNIQAAGSGPANLAAARRIVSCGRGFKAEEDLAMANALAEALGAEIACSRPLAEGTAWLSKDRYVGVSGMHVSPDIYVALGISGQVQHTSGMADSKIVVAVNNDENAPIFQISDYGIVGDIYEVVPALTAALS